MYISQTAAQSIVEEIGREKRAHQLYGSGGIYCCQYGQGRIGNASHGNRLFPGVGDEELDAYMKLMEVFIEEDGSVIRMADRLYVHKNTIQYKLKIMEALNGRDIRKPVGAAVIG